MTRNESVRGEPADGATEQGVPSGSRRSRPGRRAAILAAATQVLAKSGPEGFSAAAIAAEAGVSKANVFHHFGTLDDVIVEAFDALALGIPEMTPAPDADLRGWLRDLGRAMVALSHDERALMHAYLALVMRSMRDPRLKVKVEASVGEARTGLARALALLDARISDPLVLADAILMAGDGIAFHAGLFPERRAAITKAWDALADAIASQWERKS